MWDATRLQHAEARIETTAESPAPSQERLREAARLELCRRRLLPFVKETFPAYEIAPVHRLVASELEAFEQQVVDRLSPRLIINLPFRIGKSELVSRRFPPWVLGRHPDWNVGLVSYGAELAEELSADARRVVMSDEYAQVFGAGEFEVEIDRTSKAVGYWRINRRHGGLRAVGVGGALTGRGFDVGIIDDPIKGRKEADSKALQEELFSFYKGTYYPRIEPGGGIIIMQTRWTVRDLVGRLMSEIELDEDVDRWRVVCVPAEAYPYGTDPLGRAPGEFMEGRFTAEQWRRIKANLPPREWLAQAQQQPMPPEGQIFTPYETFVFADPPETEDGGEFRGPRFGFTDTSYARTRLGDYSANQVWQIEPPGADIDGVVRPTLGLLDCLRGRYQFPELKRVIKDTYDRYRLWGQVIEDYGSGTSVAQEFRRNAGMKIITWRPDRDKVARAHSATDVMATFRIRLPVKDKFPSGLPVRTYLEELAAFPDPSVHDDLVDTTSMAMILIGVKDMANSRRMRTLNFAFVE